MDEIIEDIFSDKRVVVVTGAGVSVESGIPCFRGKNGVYTRHPDAENILRYEFLSLFPDKFYEFYKENLMVNGYEPNDIHKILAKLEKMGLIDGIITQNVDGLHQKAGSQNVIELHGNGERFCCTECSCTYNSEDYINNGFKCSHENCRGIIYPDIVLYDEFPPINLMDNAHNMLLYADTVLVLGSSLSVRTIQKLLNFFLSNGLSSKRKLFIINDEATPYDYRGTRVGCDLKEAFQKVKSVSEEKNNH